MLQRRVTVDVKLTPDELASEFASMDSEQQAIFFNELAEITSKWDAPFCFQLQSIIDDPALTVEGRHIMEAIGDYGAGDK